jgi:hypothetical protein
MAGNLINNFIKNDMGVLVSCIDNLCRAETQLLIHNAWKYLSYPLTETKIFILSCNVGTKKYKVQQVDIGILFRLSIWVHLVIRSFLLHLEPL